MICTQLNFVIMQFLYVSHWLYILDGSTLLTKKFYQCIKQYLVESIQNMHCLTHSEKDNNNVLGMDITMLFFCSNNYTRAKTLIIIASAIQWKVIWWISCYFNNIQCHTVNGTTILDMYSKIIESQYNIYFGCFFCFYHSPVCHTMTHFNFRWIIFNFGWILMLE